MSTTTETTLLEASDLSTFDRMESNVRCYSRSFPKVFSRGEGDVLIDDQEDRYIDFFAGAGALNYGHNPAILKQSLLDYIESDAITHSLDLATTAKEKFLLAMEEKILKPRGLDYKIMFPGPTGTNAVEAALKLARLYTGRSNIVSFTNAFHGMTLGSLAVTGSEAKRQGAGVMLPNVSRMPFCGYMDDDLNTLDLLERHLTDASSGMDLPAALILETVQAEGGVNVASVEWLQRLSAILKKHGVLLIVDDIQVGCGRTGKFFSFEDAGICPDIVCLSKSLSGYGLPFAVTMFQRALDIWEPGKHNGTFRGNNLAFVTATRAIEEFWSDDRLSTSVNRKAKYLEQRLKRVAQRVGAHWRGRGLIQGLEFTDHQIARKISAAAFQEGVLIETAGPEDQVLKFLPPLTVDEITLAQGLDIICDAIVQLHSEAEAESTSSEEGSTEPTSL